MALLSAHRLKKNADFLRVLRGRAKRIKTVFGTVVVLRCDSPAAQFGFVVSKKVSSQSVARNLLKRRTSEWVRKKLSLFQNGLVVIFLFEKGADLLSRRVLYEELENVCGRAGLFRH